MILLYVIVRVDRRFWVPNGARAAGDYAAGGKVVEIEKGVERGIMPEEEVFDDAPEADVVSAEDGRKGDLEEGKISGSEEEVGNTANHKEADGKEAKI